MKIKTLIFIWHIDYVRKRTVETNPNTSAFRIMVQPEKTWRGIVGLSVDRDIKIAL